MISETKKIQRDFQAEFLVFSKDKSSGLSFPEPYFQAGYDIGFGHSKAHISYKANKKVLHCEIDIPNSKETYKQFYGCKVELEKKFGGALKWMEKPETKLSRIRISQEDFDLVDRGRWPEYFKWLLENIKKFQDSFSPFVSA